MTENIVTPEGKEIKTPETSTGKVDVAEQAPIRVTKQAIVQWFDEEGKPTDIELLDRSLASLLVNLGNYVEEGTRKEEDLVRVTLKVVDEEGKDTSFEGSDGKKHTEIILAEKAPLGKVLSAFAERSLSGQQVMGILQNTVEQLSNLSRLKMLGLSFLFEGGPAGVIFESQAVEVTDDDRVRLNSAMQMMVDSHAKGLENDGIVTPDTAGDIIIPTTRETNELAR